MLAGHAFGPCIGKSDETWSGTSIRPSELGSATYQCSLATWLPLAEIRTQITRLDAVAI